MLAGFPEDARDKETEDKELDWLTHENASLPYDARASDLRTPPEFVTRLYNSAILTDRVGKTVHVFRKHFLYKDDKTWAQEGT